MCESGPESEFVCIGPGLESDLLEYILKKADDNRVCGRPSNDDGFTLKYHMSSAPESMAVFGRWYARMAYFADRQETLEESYAFWDHLNTEALGIVKKFMNDHASKNDMLSIQVRPKFKGAEETGSSYIEFIWYWRHPEKRLKTDEFTFYNGK